MDKSGYQAEIFRPFKEIFEKSASPQIKEYSLICVNSMLLTSKGNVKSAYFVVFDLIQLTIDSDSDSIYRTGFELMRTVVASEDEELANNFPHLISLLHGYSSSVRNKDIRSSSLDCLLSLCCFLTWCADVKLCNSDIIIFEENELKIRNFHLLNRDDWQERRPERKLQQLTQESLNLDL